jgi:Protein of unknown function (DUF2927)
MKNLVLFFLTTLLAVSCKKNEQPPYDNSDVPVTGKTFTADEVKCFKQLTINGEFGGNGTIKKLRDRIVYVYLADTGYAYMNAELDRIMDDINKQTDTNLVLRKTADKSQALIKVHLTDRQTYIGLYPSTASSFTAASYELHGLCYYNTDGNYNITQAGAFVDMVRTAGNVLNQRFILRHEITHALGFLGHTNMPAFESSIMYHTAFSTRVIFSAFDERIIKLLYNPALKPGMNEFGLNAALVNL